MVKSEQQDKNCNWWKNGVIYQIYPRSFQDSNNDGVGDILGIISRLDYLKWLGVSAIWLNPVYPSPGHDFGYDIKDFRNIDPLFGTMKDFDLLVKEAHKRGLKLIMDITFNHTSSEHPWFIESRSSKDSPKRDWYIWHKGKGHRRPNNWVSMFGGSAWEYDTNSKEYYLHLYLKNQPDLNWLNPEVRKEMFDNCDFWFRKGVDGFRMDSAHTLVKRAVSRNNRLKIGVCQYDTEYTDNLAYDKTRNIWKEFRKHVDHHPGHLIVGEIDPSGLDHVEREKFYGNRGNEFNLVFDFSLVKRLWSANSFRKSIENWMNKLPGTAQPCWVLNNHDIPRSIVRYALINKWARLDRAKIAATIMFTLKGTPFVYYGEEIGLVADIKRRHLKDPLGKKYWPFYKGRDTSRTPMQWDGGLNSGFSESNELWLPIGKNYKQVNVQSEMADSGSLLNYYRELISLRKSEVALHLGTYKNLYSKRGLWVYSMSTKKESALVILNFSSLTRKYLIPSEYKSWRQLISSKSQKREIASNTIKVMPNEAIILTIK